MKKMLIHPAMLSLWDFSKRNEDISDMDRFWNPCLYMDLSTK